MTFTEGLTVAVAGYAALVASTALGWQIFTWWKGRQPRVECYLTNALPVDTDGNIVGHWISVKVRNKGSIPVNVQSVGVFSQTRPLERLFQMHIHPWATLPGIVKPHDSGESYFLRQDLEEEGIDMRKPLQGWAELATGERVESKKTTLGGDD